jgi:5'-nucleotidase
MEPERHRVLRRTSVILLVNDDGIAAPGLRAMYRALRRICQCPVLAVAPTSERSGQGHAITIDRNLSVSARLEEGFFGFAIDGTPTDCTKLALNVLCREPPNLVVSGINDGPNVGRSLFYSGTVAAALEAAVLGLPAMAVSRSKGGEDFEDAAEFAGQWAKRLLATSLLQGQVLNINLPAGSSSSWQEAQIAVHGKSGFMETYQPVRDHKERIAWRLRGEWVARADGQRDDASLLSAGHPVLTLLAPSLNAGNPPFEEFLRSQSGPYVPT